MLETKKIQKNENRTLGFILADDSPNLWLFLY